MGKIFYLLIVTFSLCVFLKTAYGVLVAIPTDDLLGPDACPMGSYCIETEYCTNEYYTTKSGNPFYCGPRHSIDSKVCCLETEITPTPMPPLPEDMYENDLDLESLMLSPRHSSSLPNSTDDDDEVDILTLADLGTINNSLEMEDMSFDSNADATAELEALLNATSSAPDSGVNSAAEQEILDELEVHSAPPAPIVRETSLDGMDDKEQTPIMENTGSTVQTEEVSVPAIDFHVENADAGVESRMIHGEHNINEMQRFVACPCEKGEKGDQGPRGEPGEPGKIIYIPVFVSNLPSAPTPQTGNQVPPNIHLTGGQPSSTMPPPHPSPVVVPYSVQIPNLQPNLPIAQPVPAAGQPPVQQYAAVPPAPVPITPQPPRAPITPPNPALVPHTEDPQARLFRQTHMTMTDPRFANRKL